MISSIYNYEKSVYNIAKIILRNASLCGFPQKIAVINGDEEKEFSYLQLAERVKKVSTLLYNTGIKKGDRVVTLLQNSFDTISIFLGCLNSGVIYTPLNYRLSQQEIEFLIEDYQPKLVITEPQFVEKLKNIVSHITIFELNKEPSFSANKSFYQLIEQTQPQEVIVETSPDDVCCILSTAGTTGRPKGVKLSYRNIFFAVISHGISAGVSFEDIFFSTGVLFHSGGLAHLFPLIIGGTIVLLSKWEPKKALELINRYKVSQFWTITTQLKQIIDHPRWEEYVKSVKLVLVGGEAQPMELRKKFTSIGIKYAAAYGLTETAASGIIGPPVDNDHPILKKDSTCIGLPERFLEVKIITEDGKEAGVNEVGEIVIRKEPVGCLGYWNRPEEEKTKFRDGWIFTGDMGKYDEEGYFYVLGRKDDMIKSGGENIYPQEIERVIYSHPKVADVVVVRGKHPVWGQTPKAVIVVKQGETLTEEEIVEYVKQHLASFKKPGKIVFVDSLPLSSTGKVDRKKVKQLYEEI